MKKLLSPLIAALLAASAAPAGATPFHVMGPRAMGMGGAQVALAQGPLASYWNPAGLGQLYNTSGLVIPVSVRGEFTGTVLEGANDLREIKEQCDALGVGVGICTNANVQKALDKINQGGNGATIDLGGSVSFKLKRAVLFVHSLSYIGATPEAQVTANNTAATISTNQSKLILRGANFIELGLGYGREIKESGFILGANLKGIIGRVGYDELKIALEDPGAGSFGDYKTNIKTSFQPSLDAGFLWDMRETWANLPLRPRFGLVGRNLNGPKFNQPASATLAGDRGKFKLGAQARAGFALSPFKFWHLATDLDLTDNLSLIDGQKSRFFGAGTELNVFNRPGFNIPLRAGLQKNVSRDADSALAFTGGFGLNFLHVMVDVSGMISSKKTRIQSEGKLEKIPNNAAGSVQFALLFGGEDEGGRNR